MGVSPRRYQLQFAPGFTGAYPYSPHVSLFTIDLGRSVVYHGQVNTHSASSWLNTVVGFLFSMSNKPSRNPAELVQLLRDRGLTVDEPAKAEALLRFVNYYKLRAYFIPFEVNADEDGHSFKPGTNFRDIFSLYRFDRKLRILVNDMLERFELAVRTRWAFEMSQAGGPYVHENSANFTDSGQHQLSLDNLVETYKKSKEQFAEHHQDRYPKLLSPPVWVSVELFSFGEMSHWLQNTKSQAIRKRVSSSFGVEPSFFETYVRQASTVRNMCSHHSRLWNRPLPFPLRKIRWAKFDKALLNNRRGESNKLYNFLAVLNFIANEISPGHSWSERLLDFLGKDETRLKHMGFPKDWRRAFK